MPCCVPNPSSVARRLSASGAAAVLLLLLPASLPAQVGVAPAPLGATQHAEEVQIAHEALPAAADAALAAGREFERQGLWGDAVAHYENALREFPTDRRLERRFDVARLHYSLERRYADESFLETLRALDGTAAADMYGELLAKIGAHYVVAPPWARIVEQGATAVLIAAADRSFTAQHGVRPTAAQVQALTSDIRRRLGPHTTVGDAASASRLAREIARTARRRVGVSESAWMLEFVAAAAGGLDNYSAFLTPGQLRDVYAQIEGNFVGLGVELKADEGALLIVRVIPGSPAERAGIAAGDRIVGVDGRATADLSTDEAASMLTGVEGSLVQVTVASPSPAGGSTAPHLVARPIDGQTPTAGAATRVVSVRREHVDVPSLDAARITDRDYGVAYIRIPVFQKTTARDLESALWDLHRQGMRSLVIDLRGNPGGLLTAAVELADKFVAQGNLVSTRGRSEGEDFDYRAHRAGTWRVPLVVLIDGDSASASEIFAAAIRDNRRGTIVGARSFGKGSVQGIFPMTRAGAGIRLTTARFFSPNGHPISKIGVSPDIVVRRATSVAEGQSGVGQTVGYRGGAPSDPALDRAVEAARQQVALR